MTGFRIGYAAGSSKFVSLMTKLQESTVACVSTISQKAALEALQAEQGDIKKMIDEYSIRRELLFDRMLSIPRVKPNKPKGGFYAFINIKDLDRYSEHFSIELLKSKKVCVVPGSAFGESGEGYIRVSFSASQQNIIEGTERIKKFVEENYGSVL